MKRLLRALLLALCVVHAVVPVASAVSAEHAQITINQDNHDYGRTASTVKSYLVENEQGYLRLEYYVEVGYNNGWTYTPMLFAEQFNTDLQFISRRTLTMELPIFGGFHTDGTYYYLVFGQENPNESNTVEIMRVVKYDKTWTKLEAVSIKGANTTIPFHAGSLRMVNLGSTLFIHTCHEMYMADDGKNHQANMTYNINTSTMKVVEQRYSVSNIGTGYVSHSFNQYITLDGTTLLTLDHGDAYPRSAVLCKYNNAYNKNPLSASVSSVDLITYVNDDTVNYNYTGACVGGMEAVSGYYITAGSSIRQDGTVPISGGQRNIYITVTPKSKFTEADSSLVWLTSYADNANVDVNNPHLVKIDDNKLAVIWTEVTSGARTLKYTFLNAKGEKTSVVYEAEGQTSDCKPIVSGKKILWYVTNNSGPVFYYIDMADENGLTEYHQHIYEYEMKAEPSLETEGTIEGQCNFCGQKTENIVVPKLNETDYVYEKLTDPSCDFSGYGRYTWKNTEYCDVQVLYRIPAAGHIYEEATVIKTPTHKEYGMLNAACTRCKENRDVYLPALNQWDYSIEATQSATCLEKGYGFYVWKETRYGDIRFEAEVPPAGHDLETITTEASCTANGTLERKCRNCDYSTKYTTAFATGHSFGEWTTNDQGQPVRTCTICGEVETGALTNPFVDINENMFCYDAVLWAYYGDITTGKDATHFDPSGACTRAQVVTFLWRAAGKPAPKSMENPFPDVPVGKYYTDAVLWAVENHITEGFKDGTFGPGKTCTRAQIVTFLWRYAGEPAPESMDNPFPDVDVNAYYGQAVLWAVEEGITGGFKDGTFGPNKTCTRDQIVTFLYRYLVT